jgi:hypothetical protein
MLGRSKASGFATPEEAARGDIPERYARAAGTLISPDGDNAIVFLLANEEPWVEELEVHCSRGRDGRWGEEGSASGFGFGWYGLELGTAPPRGVLHFAYEAPEGAREAILLWRYREFRLPASNGYFFFADWDAPDDFYRSEPARIVRYVRDDGSEAEVTDDENAAIAEIWSEWRGFAESIKKLAPPPSSPPS